METSDSEYFESADEDIQSDDENTNSVILSNEASKKVDNLQTRVNNLHLVDNKKNLKDTKDVNKNLNTSLNKANLMVDSPTKFTCPEETQTQNNSKNGVGKGVLEKVKEAKELGAKETAGSAEAKTSGLVADTAPKSDEVETIDDKHTVKNITSGVGQNEYEESTDIWDDDELDWGKESELEANNACLGATANIDKPQSIKSNATEEENLWEDEDWQPLSKEDSKQITSIKEKETCVNENSTGWGSWGNWGVTSILSTATQGVSTITSQVSQGFNTILETGMGIPEPEEMARINTAEKKLELQEEENQKLYKEGDTGLPIGFGIGNLVSGVSHLTKFVESTSTKVISGGLDTLETIGKKTMEVLQEGDPGLKKKRAFLKISQDKPNLSQVLREAKEKAEIENKVLEHTHLSQRAKNYETLFDDYQGLVHLEALELLSKQCDIKLQALLDSASGDELIDLQETLGQVKDICELPDDDEEEHPTPLFIIDARVQFFVDQLHIDISFDKIASSCIEIDSWINDLDVTSCDEKKLHQKGIETLAQLTAMSVEMFHKIGELLLLKRTRSTAHEAESLVEITITLTSAIGLVAAKFSEKLNAKAPDVDNKDYLNELITNIFYEAANSSSYIQDAFQLMIPVLQVGAVV